MGHVGRERDIAPGDRFVGARDGELTVLEFDVGVRGLEQVARDLFGLVDDLFGGAHHGRATDRDRARAIGAHAEGDLGGVTMNDVDHRLVNAKHFGNHLREGGFVPLPVAVCADKDGDGAGGVHPDRGRVIEARAGAELANEVGWRDATGLDKAVDAKTAQFAVLFGLCTAGCEARDVHQLFHLVHGRMVVAGVIGHRDGRFIREFRDEVLAAERDRIDTKFAGGFVDDALKLERRLGATCPTIGVNGHGVGEHRFYVHLNRRRLVVAGHQGAVQPCWHGGGECGQIRAHVRHGVSTHADKVVVRIQRQFDLGHVVAAMGV